jgi:hypothetical protein
VDRGVRLAVVLRRPLLGGRAACPRRVRARHDAAASHVLPSRQGGRGQGGAAVRDATALGRSALPRVAASGRRNRGRLVFAVAAALGVDVDVASVADSSNHADDAARTAILLIDSHTNTLRPESATGATLHHTPGTAPSRRGWVYHAGSYDAATSQGAATCSCISDGMLLFTTPAGEHDISIRNAAENSLPFGTRRLCRTQDLVAKAAERLSESTPTADAAQRIHPDSSWINERFGWKKTSSTSTLLPIVAEMAPAQLWGSHRPASWLMYSRELCVDGFNAIRLDPELVCLAGTEVEKLRGAARVLQTRKVS